MASRGIRNNNPLNIRRGAKWKGLREVQTDPLFAQFTDMAWGIRAGAVLLRNYAKRYKAKNLWDIIHRWAPPEENHTTDYLRFVARESGVNPIDELNVNDKDTLMKIISAMTLYECGENIPQKIIAYGINLL